MRLIDADKLEPHEFYDGFVFVEAVYMDDIREMPTIEAEPIRHGHWIDNGKYWYVCSVCDYIEPLSDLMDEHYKYCPNCGAKMDASGEQ